jgi:pyrroloquinoline quinone (PQQ) biosynthesis protein C
MKQVMKVKKIYLDLFFQGPFFYFIDTFDITPEQWKVFLLQKYGSVAYFLDFLQKGAELCRPHSPELSDVFLQNYQEEIGNFGGTVIDEYSHEIWRRNSLQEFGISTEDLARVALLPSTQAHSDELVGLAKSNDFLEYCGALFFLEAFVVREMNELIKAFERTIPQMFPKGGYKKAKAPHNTHEYWYNHRTHDVNHFKQIKLGLENYFTGNPDNAKLNELRVISGIAKVSTSKLYLYDQSLYSAMLNA